MTLLLLLAFFGLSTGFLFLLHLTPRTLLQELTHLLTHAQPRKHSISKLIHAVQRPKNSKAGVPPYRKPKRFLGKPDNLASSDFSLSVLLGYRSSVQF